MLELTLLFFVGAVASAINAVAGGGSLLTYPFLTVGLGIAPVTANASNSVALWPGSLAGALGLLNQLARTGRYFWKFALPTAIGAAVGAELLVHTSQRSFVRIVPWLILISAVVIAAQPRIKTWTTTVSHHASSVWSLGLQVLVAIYGGYFGAGMGIMMLAAFALSVEGDIHELNAIKNWLALLINLVASVYFISVGIVLVHIALVLAAGAIVGGLVAARLSQRIESERLRVAIAIYGFAMAAFFFYRALGA